MKIVMPYIGGILSVNSYKIRDRRGRQTNKTKTVVLIWMEMLTKEARSFERNGDLTIELFGKFKDERSTPDLANLHKVIGDAIKEAISLDDKYFNFIDKGYKVGFSEPVLEIELTSQY